MQYCKYDHAAGRDKRGECLECTRVYRRRWYAANRAAAVAAAREYGRLHRAENRAKTQARVVQRRARKQRQTCNCCEIKDFWPVYREASSRGFHVDHILALINGGLHCLHNLQILSPAEHQAKTAADLRLWRLNTRAKQ
jgi:hypothetical protein